MSSEAGAEFDIGRAVPFHVARDPVNVPVMRRWCDAVGDRNPVHTDPAVADRSRFGTIVAPLAMLDVWTKPGLAYRRDPADPQGGAFELLDREGFTSAVAVSSQLEQGRPLECGDLVQSTLMLEAVSEEKHTALGRGHFVTSRQELLVGGEPVGRVRFTVLRFRPGTGSARPSTKEGSGSADRRPAAASAPARDELGTVLASGLTAGHAVPSATIPVTTTLIVAGALMTADYFDAHHDRDAAVRRGSPDIFMNIHTTLGLVEATVGNWLGPNAQWRSMSARLGVPNHPEDEMIIVAEISTVDPRTGATAVGYRATNGLGVHASGEIVVELPTG